MTWGCVSLPKKTDRAGMYFNNNKLSIFAGSAALIIGSVLGSMYLMQSASQGTQEITDALAQMLASGGKREVFISSVISAAQIWIILWLCGTCRAGMIPAPLVLAVRSFICSFSVAAMIKIYMWRGIAAVFAGVFVQMLLLFPAMQIMCSAAINQSQANARLSDKASKRRGFAAYSIFDAIIFCAMIASCMYDVYISRVIMAKIIL